MLAPDWVREPLSILTVPAPEIGIAPPMPLPPKFMMSAPLSATALPPPTRNAELPAPHCIVAPLSITTAPPSALAPVNTTVPLGTLLVIVKGPAPENVPLKVVVCPNASMVLVAKSSTV